MTTHPFVKATRLQQLEMGGAIVSLRQKGYRWDDLAAAFGLADANEARHYAVAFLLANATERGTGGPTNAG